MRRTLIAVGLMLAVGCEEKKAPPAAPTPAPAPSAAAPAPAAAPGAPAAAPGAAPAAAAGGKGTIKGTVTLTGKAPVAEELKRSADPFCAKSKVKDPSVIQNANKTLKNVVVHVNGAPAVETAPTDAVIVSQNNCMYEPRVQVAVAGQNIKIKNGDPVLHNVHTYKGTSTVFNQAQVPGSPDIEKKFSDAGALLKFKCDVHQWMTGFIWVQNNALSVVTGDDGSFEIKNVPAGAKVEVEAWHERFGSKKVEVAVEADKTVEAKFEYTGTETASN